MTFLEAIKSLGETPEEVTQALREKGIKGYRCMAGSCPVANYLKACGFSSVTVSCYASMYVNSDKENADERHYLPAGVRQWITNFDDGKYPEFYLV